MFQQTDLIQMDIQMKVNRKKVHVNAIDDYDSTDDGTEEDESDGE